jgi:uncharacterized protein YcbK (DUF882 family)
MRVRYFALSELLQSGGAPQTLPKDREEDLRQLAVALDSLRGWWGRPITITSGYRSPERNEAVGGVPDSLHVLARAVDCYSEPFGEFVAFCSRWWPGGVGIYKSHVHLDTGANRRWRV